jgi:hypothetical protein
MDEPIKLKVSVDARTWTNIGVVKRAFSISSISVWRDQYGVSIELEGISYENLNARTKFRLSDEESKALAQLLFAVNHET